MFRGIYGIGKESNGGMLKRRALLKSGTNGLRSSRAARQKPVAGDSPGAAKPRFGGQKPIVSSPAVKAEKKDSHLAAPLSQKNIGTTKSDKKRAENQAKPVGCAKPQYGRAGGVTGPIGVSEPVFRRIVTANELANRWGYSPKTINRWLRTDRLPFGEEPVPCWRLDLDDVEAFEKENPWVLQRKPISPTKAQVEEHTEKKGLPKKFPRL